MIETENEMQNLQISKTLHQGTFSLNGNQSRSVVDYSIVIEHSYHHYESAVVSLGDPGDVGKFTCRKEKKAKK
jgi:hypothetical protein